MNRHRSYPLKGIMLNGRPLTAQLLPAERAADVLEALGPQPRRDSKPQALEAIDAYRAALKRYRVLVTTMSSKARRLVSAVLHSRGCLLRGHRKLKGREGLEWLDDSIKSLEFTPPSGGNADANAIDWPAAEKRARAALDQWLDTDDLEKLANVPPERRARWRQSKPRPRRARRFHTIQSVLDRAEADFGDVLAFRLNSASETRKPFKWCDELYDVLAQLAEHASGGSRCCLNNRFVGHLAAWSYASTQSKVTVGMARREYETTYGGRRLALMKHIGRGKAFDARYTLRVGFASDAERGKLVIGYIGQHQWCRRSR